MMKETIPLCVDLDGTLIHTDLLLESFLLLVKRNPLYLLMIPLWLLQGKAHLKRQIAMRVQMNSAALPYTKPLLEWLRHQRELGRPLWLVTASDERLARPVADHLQLFDGVMASDGQANLAGGGKARALVAAFGEKGFDYAGNHAVDLKVWPHARRGIVVNGGGRLEAAAQEVVDVEHIVPGRKGIAKPVLKALRVHQWAKNALIFVPVLAAHQILQGPSLWQALLAFLAFSLCASSVYLLNDMLDLEADRQHHSKCERPFAAGRVSLMFGLVAAPLLLVFAALIALSLPLKFAGVLLAYYLATLAYSFGVKKIVMVDVLALAGLYTVRIVAGAAACSIPLSFWLLLFAGFIFLSLALVKRYAELHVMRQQGKLKAKGRGYQVEDLALLQSLGAASGYLSVLVLALYLNSPDVARMYSQPKLVWGLVPVMLYWISRIWMETYRGRMHDDPLVYAMKDPMSLATGALAGVLLFLAV
jgi:4-hydroxybenzoate polyprenyltransferase/phosphoserine phosphatase